MKLLPLLAVLLASQACAADNTCEARVQHAFDVIKPRAVLVVPALQATTWKFKWFMPDAYLAQTRLAVPDIEVNKGQLCPLGDAEVEAVIAHEFGHLINRALMSERMLTPAGKEDYANYYGAKLVPDSTAYLAVIDARCVAGSKYFCEAAKAWRKGLEM